MQHYPFPSGLFNHTPQCHRLEHTSVGDYAFSNNVVLEALRVVNQGSCSYKPPALAVGLLTLLVESETRLDFRNKYSDDTLIIEQKLCHTIAH